MEFRIKSGDKFYCVKIENGQSHTESNMNVESMRFALILGQKIIEDGLKDLEEKENG